MLPESASTDFVVTDGNWVEQVKQAKTLPRRSKIDTRIAELYSTRGGGAETFLRRLEAWPLVRDSAS
jgi:hypothetical protein